MNGIDVSAFQGVINWPAVNKSFALIRATDGVGINADGLVGSVDTRFHENWAGAARIRRGAYHVLENQSIPAQFDLFFKTVPQGGPVALDIEPGAAQSFGAKLESVVTQWLEACSQARSSKGLVYVDESVQEKLQVPKENLWLAGPSLTQAPSALCWQTGTSTVPGVPTQVDTDTWLGTPQDWDSLGGLLLSDYPIVSCVMTSRGTWYAAQDGGVFTVGGAGFFGTTYNLGLTGLKGSKPLASAIVNMSVTSTEQGYWLVGGDGGVFNFGDAQFFGSAYSKGFTGLSGAKPLPKPIVQLIPTPDNLGYWLLCEDGTMLSFGAASAVVSPTLA
jgi:hypothetical protein